LPGEGIELRQTNGPEWGDGWSGKEKLVVLEPGACWMEEPGLRAICVGCGRGGGARRSGLGFCAGRGNGGRPRYRRVRDCCRPLHAAKYHDTAGLARPNSEGEGRGPQGRVLHGEDDSGALGALRFLPAMKPRSVWIHIRLGWWWLGWRGGGGGRQKEAAGLQVKPTTFLGSVSVVR